MQEITQTFTWIDNIHLHRFINITPNSLINITPNHLINITSKTTFEKMAVTHYRNVIG